MASIIYNRFKKNIGDGTHDWDSGAQTYRVLFTTAAYTPNADHNFVSEVTNELSGGGYARQDLANRSVVQDDANDRADYKADTVAFTGLTNGQTARYAVVLRHVTNDADSPLVAAIDLGAGGVVMTGDLSFRWDSNPTNGRIFSIA